MGRKTDAATKYRKYLQSVQKGTQAQHGYNRLAQWGYLGK